MKFVSGNTSLLLFNISAMVGSSSLLLQWLNNAQRSCLYAGQSRRKCVVLWVSIGQTPCVVYSFKAFQLRVERDVPRSQLE